VSGEHVLVVDDDLSLRQFLQILLERDGYAVRVAASGDEALRLAEVQWPDLVLTDLNMPGMSGMELLRALKTRAAEGLDDGRADLEVVMVTAYGTAESAVMAMKHGASDYVLKPFNNDELRLVVRRALGRRELEAENTRLKAALQQRYHFGNLVGSSKAMQAVYLLIHRVKDTPISVLISGESGTGKEMVARAIHYSGNRASGAFVAINCGAIPENLVESELFGHKRGAFTGAVRDKQGLMQEAHGGTLFLDEVNSLPLGTQVKLLRAIQERRFTPVGGTREVEVDVRILAATNADLEERVKSGEFREDLYYRLNVVQLHLPPLRERAEDVHALVSHFVTQVAEQYGKPVSGVAPDALQALKLWNYPGNVRELRNVIERAVALSEGTLLRRADLPDRMLNQSLPPRQIETPTSFPDEGMNLDALLASVEKRWLVAAMEQADGNKTQAARLLQMSFRSFRYRLAKYDLDT
jgi:two-component system response regulator PilR (NtrC family)